MKRVQRKRTKGYKLPDNTKCVNRGTKWGNPFKVILEAGYWVVRDKSGNYWGQLYTEKIGAVEKSIECYSGWVDGQIGIGNLDAAELAGKNLACFCPLDQPCHADYLLQIAACCLVVKETNFDKWYEDTVRLVVAKQSKPFASYKKNKWVSKNGIWKQMYNEGATAIEAVNLWALNHQK